MGRFVLSHEVAQAWADAGVIEDVHTVRRLVLDLRVGAVPVLYTERYGDKRLLSVTQTLEGVEIRRDPDPVAEEQAFAEASAERARPFDPEADQN